jgi:hypothetical protein
VHIPSSLPEPAPTKSPTGSMFPEAMETFLSREENFEKQQ